MRTIILAVILLSGCTSQPQPAAPDYRSARGYLPAYPQYEMPTTARDTVVLGQGGIAVCH